MPASYVKPHVKRQKNDAAEAEAICEAVTRPTMRFVDAKSPQQQSVMVIHKMRLMLMRQRIQLSNAIRGLKAEFGLVAPIGREGLQSVIKLIVHAGNPRGPKEPRSCLELLSSQLQLLNAQILETDQKIRISARSTDVGPRLMEIPGVGPLLASALVASVADPKAFKRGRNLAAWVGLVSKPNSSGRKERLGGITKQGERWPWCDPPSDTAHIARGSFSSSRAGRPRSRPSLWPTRPPTWGKRS